MKVTLFIGTGALLASTAAATIFGLSARHGSPSAVDPWWRDAQSLTAAEAATDDYFGSCVALDGERALIAAPCANVHGARSGAIYAFDTHGSQSLSQLGVEDAEVSSAFGSSVAMCGNLALVGKPGDSQGGEEAGAALLYERDEHGTWQRIAKLTADDARANAEFGLRVALDARFALVGTRYSRYTGAVYVFERENHSTWRQSAKLVPQQRAEQECFASSLAIHGNLAVVGAPRDLRGPDGYLGTAYVFEHATSTGWRQIAVLTPPLPTNFEQFGQSVAIRDKTILVGAPSFGDAGGTAYLFRQDDAGAWRIAAQVTSPCAETIDSFGDSVAMNENLIAVAAPFEKDASGAVYLFQITGEGPPRHVARLALPGQPFNQLFGIALAMGHDALLVGAPHSDGRTPKSGAAYLFHLTAQNDVSRVSALERKHSQR